MKRSKNNIQPEDNLLKSYIPEGMCHATKKSWATLFIDNRYEQNIDRLYRRRNSQESWEGLGKSFSKRDVLISDT